MQRGFTSIIILPLVLIVAGAFIVGYYIRGNPISVTNNNLAEEMQEAQEESVVDTATQDSKNGDVSESEEPFCESYGTFEVRKNDLFEEYSVGPGETMRDIAGKKLGDESRALELIDANPALSRYEIDDELTMGMNLFIPNEKYFEAGITSYMRARGNITFNDTKPMFGVNAPNSATGPFIISKRVEVDLEKINEGYCVEVIYGSKGFDPQKVVFEVTRQ